MSTAETATESGEAQDRFSRFVEFFRAFLKDFELNTILFAEIREDEDLPLSARAIAVGVLVYVRAARDIIPDLFPKLKILGLLDDVLVMAGGLSIIVPLIPEERLDYYRAKYTAVAKIHEYDRLLQETLGMLWDRLRQFVEGLKNRKYKKASAEEIVKSLELSEDLFDEAMIYVANLNLDPGTIDEGIKQLPPPETVFKLLAGGLEEEEERERKARSSNASPSGFRRLLPAGDEQAQSKMSKA